MKKKNLMKDKEAAANSICEILLELANKHNLDYKQLSVKLITDDPMFLFVDVNVTI